MFLSDMCTATFMTSDCRLTSPWNIKFIDGDTAFCWIYSCPRFKPWFVLIIFHQCLFEYAFSFRHLQKKIIIYLKWNNSLNQTKLSNVIIILLNLPESDTFSKMTITLLNSPFIHHCVQGSMMHLPLCLRPRGTPATVFKAQWYACHAVFKAQQYAYHWVQSPAVHQMLKL